MPEAPAENKSAERENVPPIMACYSSETSEDCRNERFTTLLKASDEELEAQNDDVLFVNFLEPNTVSAERRGFKNAGSSSYTISPIDERGKISKKFVPCLGLVVVGTEEDSETGKEHEISFMSHQNPAYVAKKGHIRDRNEAHIRDKFAKDMPESLEEMRKRCKPGSIDAVIIGGTYAHDKRLGKQNTDNQKARTNYENGIELLQEQVKTVLGFTPTVMHGPKIGGGEDAVFLETGYDDEGNVYRHLFLHRSTQEQDTGSYEAQNLAEERHKWLSKYN